MFRVGLTGGIASGKTTVADGLAKRGAVVIDYDVLARAVVEPGSPALSDVVARFGADLLTSDGHLDRAKLGALVFSDDAARADLNTIVHPWVRATAAEIERQIVDPYTIVVHVVPLLVESGLAKSFDTVAVVDVDPAIQLSRLMARNGYTAAEAQARIASQTAREDRFRVASFIIDNSGTPDELEPLIDGLWAGLQHDQHSDRYLW